MVAINVPAVISWLYRAAWVMAVPLARGLARGPGKLARTARGRLEGLATLRRWAAASRDTSRPLVWFHAASVGEGRQAEAVMREVRRARPDWQAAFTFASASAERIAAALPTDTVAFLPPDTAAAMGAALDALRPAAVVFCATDVWPELVRQAGLRATPVALVSANLAATSSRRGTLARALLEPAYRSLARVGAIDDADAAGLGRRRRSYHRDRRQPAR
jgi:3-deoxy-D-manno-octulosonic-acid transferase